LKSVAIHRTFTQIQADYSTIIPFCARSESLITGLTGPVLRDQNRAGQKMRVKVNSQSRSAIYAGSPKRKTVHLGCATQHLPVTIRLEHTLLFAVVSRVVQRLCHGGTRVETQAFKPIREKDRAAGKGRFGKLFKICEVGPAIFASLFCFVSRHFSYYSRSIARICMASVLLTDAQDLMKPWLWPQEGQGWQQLWQARIPEMKAVAGSLLHN
jgi:hypothetical protein